MNKIIIISITFLSLLSMVYLVSAGIELEYDTVNVKLMEGWNLVNFVAEYDRGVFERLGARAAYSFDPYKQEYIQLYPNYEGGKYQDYLEYVIPEKGASIESHASLLHSSIWVYMDEEKDFENNPVKNIISDGNEINSIKLTKGWNFLSINSEMIGKPLGNIEGNCNIEKIFHWEPRSQSFVNAQEEFNQLTRYEENIGYGFIVKVSSDCNLETQEATTSPPTIPN
jgi:hypothetical protein